MTDNRQRPSWEKEWENIKAATGTPRPGSRFTILLSFLDITPTPYGKLWRRAFDTDPFLRTELRKWAKAGVIDRIVDIDGFTELWSLPKESAGQIKEIDLFAGYGLRATIDRPMSLAGPNTQFDQPKASIRPQSS